MHILRLVFVLFGVSLSGISNAEVGFPGVNTHGYPYLGSTDQKLFAVPFPGETFNALTGEVGHRVSDLTASGNGPLPINVVRSLVQVPKGYHYEFGNMALSIPHLRLDIEASANDDQNLSSNIALSCTSWNKQSYDGIKFHYQGGVIHLARKGYLTSTTQNNFPTGTTGAHYISKSNWYLSCEGSDFIINSPNGTLYRLNVPERIHSKREWIKAGGTYFQHYHQYRIYVDEIKKYGSTLTYHYGQDPAWSAAQFRAYPPVFVGKFKDDRNVIRNKQRLESIVASNDDGSDSRSVNFHYRSNSETECPNLISHITSNNALIKRVNYTYDHYMGSAGDYAMDQCRLKRVDHRNSANTESLSSWAFEYGRIGSTYNVDFSITHDVTNSNSDDALDGRKYQQLVLPLKTVRSPKGAIIQYRYDRPLGTCEYMDIYDKELEGTYVDIDSCDEPRHRKNALTKREIYHDGNIVAGNLVSGDYVEYDLLPSTSAYRVNRQIFSPSKNNYTRKHVLTFGRIDRSTPPTTSTLNSGRRLHSGRLVEHDVYVTGNQKLVDTDFTYTENPDFINFSAFNLPSKGSTQYQYELGKWMFTYDNIRVNRTHVTTSHLGETTTTRYREYDSYNFPKYKDEYNTTESKTSRLTYDHNYGNKGRFMVGLVSETRISDTTANINSGTDHLYITTPRNSKGLVQSKIENAVTTQYTYHNSTGALKGVTDGRGNSISYNSYNHGHPSFTVTPYGTKTQWMYNTGLKYKVQDESGHQVHFRYDAYGRQSREWIGNATTGRTYFHNPLWDPGHSGNSAFKRQKTYMPGKWEEYVWYDSMARPIKSRKIDKVTNQSVWTLYEYDNLGRLVFLSDPSATNITGDSSNWPGTWVTYDGLDRIKTIKHSSMTQQETFCHGPGCNGTLGINGVANGYVHTDRQGYHTVYNHRSLGSPGHQEIMQIRQYRNAANSAYVDTTMTRNIHGFMTSVNQGGVTRTYTPYVHNGTLTTRPGSETHPEFGTRTITSYDAAGNLKNVTNYDGTQITYSHDAINRLTNVNTSTSNQHKSYTYFANGDLKTSSADGATWTFGYKSAFGLLESESLSLDGNTWAFSHSYDTDNFLASTTYPGSFIVSYTPTGFGRDKQVDYSYQGKTHAAITNASYHPSGLASSVTLGNGHVFTTTQNARDLAEQWRFEHTALGEFPMNLKYLYDSRDNVSKIEGYFHPQSGHVQNIQYDGLNRLTAASGRWGTASFAYDNQGDITSMGINGEVLTYSYDTQNRLASVSTTDAAILPGPFSYNYDGNGNITNNGNLAMTYDALNRMTSADRSSGTLGTVTQTNLYDAADRRVKRTVTKDGVTSTTYSLYDSGGALRYEQELESGEVRYHVLFDGKTVTTVADHDYHDTDNDGIPDYYERLYGLNLDDATDASEDADGDGLLNVQEYRFGLSALSSDTDRDGLPDSYEHFENLDGDLADSAADSDGDGTSNYQEMIAGTDPDDQTLNVGEITSLVTVLQKILH